MARRLGLSDPRILSLLVVKLGRRAAYDIKLAYGGWRLCLFHQSGELGATAQAPTPDRVLGCCGEDGAWRGRKQRNQLRREVSVGSVVSSRGTAGHEL
eukprot:2366155-Rhodomonas_salina.1